MSASTRDNVVDLLGNNILARVVINKATVATQVAGGFTSLWRATGQPGQGAIPTTAALVDDSTAGSLLTFVNPTSPVRSYVALLALTCGNSATGIEVHDRLSANGNCSGTTTTAQTCSVDASTGLTGRTGATDYSEIQWWLEFYTTAVTTAVTVTVAITLNDGTTTTTTVAVPAATNPGRMLPILSPTAGKYIKSVQTVTHATMTSATVYGVTATRRLTSVVCPLSNKPEVFPWDVLGLPRVADDACLMLVCIPSTTASGTVMGGGTVGQI